MKKPIQFLLSAGLIAVGLTAPAHAALVAFEAESGTIPFSATVFQGWRLDTDANALGGQSIYAEVQSFSAPTPPSDRIVNYSVTFDTAGTYDLYARLMAPTTSNDTMYYDTTFGAANDWQQIALSPANGTYVWVNLSDTGSNTYTVAAPGTVTFNIAARERQLRIDAFAFGTSADTFSDAQLSAAVIPEPSAALLGSLGVLALLRRRR